ncbi:MAG: signal peptidase I [Bacteroidales bacterium]|nr:signal peptidase I [Bacteroidales bacterium]
MGNKLFLIILFIFVIILLLKTFLISQFIMDNDYLNPYLKKGNFFIVETFNKNIKRGDIVVANSEEDKNIISIVIGLPNDKIELKNGTFFVNNEPLQDIHYDFHFWNGFNKKTDEKYLIVPSDSFLGIPTVVNQSTTNISGMFYDLSYCLFKNYDIIGKLIFPSHKVKIEPYIGEDSCNGYQPLSCPPESKYYCPEKGKPFCCSGEIIDGFCEVCSEGEAFTLDADGKNEMCCNKDYICNNRCYSRCLDSQKFICDKEFGGYCCGINQNVALDNTKKNKMCCDINYVCNGLCYSCTDVNAEFICNNKEGGFCCQPGQKLALGADDKNICCNKDYICNGLCYSICPSGQHFVCDPIKGGLCTI